MGAIGRNFGSWVALISALALHNAEEWMRDLPAWSAASTIVPEFLAADVHRGFGLALVLVTLAPVVGAIVIRRAAPKTEPMWLAILAWVLIANALWHVVLSFVTWTLMPGVFTAMALLLPVSVHVLASLPIHRTRGRIIGSAVLIMVAVPAITLAFATLVVRAMER